jgi:glycosyltransferase involved in cell wall biosynthesis
MGVSVARVIQYHSSTIGTDAIGNSILELHALLRAQGIESIVASGDEVVSRAPAVVVPASQILMASLKHSFRPNDVLLIHFSFFDAIAEQLAQLPLRKAIVYHNVTPSIFFRRVGLDSLGDACDGARVQLGRLAPLFDAAIGDSEYNCTELRQCGFKQVSTIPVFVDTESFGSAGIDPGLLLDIKRSADVNLVFIGRFVPNKGIENLISVVEIYRRVFRRTINLHLVGKVWDENYFASLTAHAGKLGVASLLRFHIDRPLNHLRTLLAAADAFVSMSEHEGFMVPIVEAFAAGCPVIALNTSAVAETMGGAGILIDTADLELVAGMIHLLTTDRELRDRVIRQQSGRALDFRSARTGRRWLDTINTLANAS